MTIAEGQRTTEAPQTRRRWVRRVLVGLLVFLFAAWLGLNALVVFSVSQVRNLTERESGLDISRLPAPDSLACCSGFRTVTYGKNLTGWHASAKEPRASIVLVHGYQANLVATTPLARAVYDEGYTVPTLIIQGEQDESVSPDNGKLLAERTNGELWLVPSVGHVDGYEILEDAYVRRALKFIERALNP